MNDFLSDIVNNVVENHAGRNVVIWGYCETSVEIEALLEDINIHVSFMVDSNHLLVDGAFVRDTHTLKGCADQYYLVIPIGRHKEIKTKLQQYGYEENRDYYYFCDCALKEEDNYYEDMHGNKIYGYWKNIQFVFSGFHSVIEIGGGVKLLGNLKINVDSDCYLRIGDRSFLRGNIYLANNSRMDVGNGCRINSAKGIMVVNNSELQIGNHCVLEEIRQIVLHKDANAVIEENCIIEFDAYITLGNGAKLHIGRGSTFNYGLRIEAVPFSKIMIGMDCMFSWNTTLLSGDGHSIFDVILSQNLNIAGKEGVKREIDIHDHVWIGSNCTIMYHSTIREGSIIGAGSIVKSEIPNNCIAAGKIAECVRKNVAWSRNDCSLDIKDCGEYCQLTKE